MSREPQAPEEFVRLTWVVGQRAVADFNVSDVSDAQVSGLFGHEHLVSLNGADLA
jgi:hypothetical protein